MDVFDSDLPIGIVAHGPVVKPHLPNLYFLTAVLVDAMRAAAFDEL